MEFQKETIIIQHHEIGKQPHSCEVSISSKGLWSASIKIYDENPDKAVKKTLTKANELAILIAEKNKER